MLLKSKKIQFRHFRIRNFLKITLNANLKLKFTSHIIVSSKYAIFLAVYNIIQIQNPKHSKANPTAN